MHRRTLDLALTQLGVGEATGHNDGVPAERYMRGDQLPWCAGLVLWANAQSDDTKIVPADNPDLWWQLRAVDALERHFKDQGWWLNPLASPQANDLAFMVRPGGKHVGVVVLVAGLLVETVEGNVGNRVARCVHKYGQPPITGYGRLPLSTSPATPSPP